MKHLLLCVAMTLATGAAAQSRTSEDRLQDLERKFDTVSKESAQKIDALTQEIEKMKLGESAEPAASQSMFGYAPAASKIYQARQNKVSLGGYGEFVYQNFSKRQQNADPAGVRDKADLLRAVLYVGYKFNDWILFNSEYEFEHASSGEGGEQRGEVSAEQAYMDFRVTEPVGVRAGLMLVPVGLVNEMHEPTTFHGVNRPSVETSVIPSTWRENGVGLYGEKGMFSYRSYLMAGLQAASDAPHVNGFNATTGIKEGAANGSQASAENFAWASRVDVTPVQGVKAGGSLYLGNADQGLVGHSVPVTLWDLHGTAEYRGAQFRALYTEIRIGNADSINAAQGFTDAARNSVGRKLFGGYAEAAFDVLTLRQGSRQSLSPFFRYERFDTQAATPGGFSKDPANSRVEYTVGLTYKPIPQVAIKADQQWKRNQARTGINQFNLGLAYIF